MRVTTAINTLITIHLAIKHGHDPIIADAVMGRLISK
jgi:hypothetical protein